MNRKKTFWGLLALLGIALLSGGVFAATSITVNGNNQLSLGAGNAYAVACDSDGVNVSTQQALSSNGIFNLATISVYNIADTCQGKVLSLGVTYGSSSTQQASWTLPTPTVSTYYFDFGGISGGAIVNSRQNATATLTQFDATQLGTIAISIQ